MSEDDPTKPKTGEVVPPSVLEAARAKRVAKDVAGQLNQNPDFRLLERRDEKAREAETRVLRAKYRSIALLMIRDLRTQGSVGDVEHYRDYAKECTDFQLGFALELYEDDKERFRKEYGDSKALALAERAATHFSD